MKRVKFLPGVVVLLTTFACQGIPSEPQPSNPGNLSGLDCLSTHLQALSPAAVKRTDPNDLGLILKNDCDEPLDFLLETSPYKFIITGEDTLVEVYPENTSGDTSVTLGSGEEKAFGVTWYGNDENGAFLGGGSYDYYGVINVALADGSAAPRTLKTETRAFSFRDGPTKFEASEHPCITLRVGAPASLKVSELDALLLIVKNTCGDEVTFLYGCYWDVYLVREDVSVSVTVPCPGDIGFEATLAPDEELVLDMKRPQSRDGDVSPEPGTRYEVYAEVDISVGETYAETYTLRTEGEALTVLP